MITFLIILAYIVGYIYSVGYLYGRFIRIHYLTYYDNINRSVREKNWYLDRLNDHKLDCKLAAGMVSIIFPVVLPVALICRGVDRLFRKQDIKIENKHQQEIEEKENIKMIDKELHLTN